jgi:phenylalanyl-tRNA synthetase beta chain
VLDQPERLPPGSIIEKKIRAILTSLGMDEIITYSLLGRKVLKAASISEEGIAEVANPLTAEQEIMRPSLIPGLLNAVLWNVNRKNKDLKLFEMGNIYVKESDSKFAEKKFLSLGIAGENSSWAAGSRAVGFFDLKGIAETLLREMGICNVSFKYAKDETFSASTCASIEIERDAAGIIGVPAKKVLSNFDIKEAVYICEISVDAIIKYADLKKRFVEPPKYPSVFRDISIIAAKNVLNADLVGLMRATASEMLKDIKLIDQYEGKQIPDGKISLTYRLEYRDPFKTLEEKQVSEAHAGILRALEEKFGAKLR